MTPRIRLVVNSILVLGLIGAIILAVAGWQELPTAPVWARLLIGVGLGGAIGIVVMFFLPVELRANLTLMFATILMSLWVASWILHERQLDHWQVRLHAYAASAAEVGVAFDTRTPPQVIKDLRRRGVDAAPILPPTTVLFDPRSEAMAETADAPSRVDWEPPFVPLAGRSRTTTVACNEHGEYVIIEADRYGFNNPDRVYSAPAPVLMLGDSFAFGYCVPPGRDIAGQLRARGVDVVSLGYPDTGPLIQLAQLREYGPIVKPSVILWLYFNGNDLSNLANEYDAPALRRYLDPSHRENLPARQAEIDAFWTDFIERIVLRSDPPSPIGDILLLNPIRERITGGTPTPAERPESEPASIDVFEELLDAMIAEAEALDAPLYFVFLPTYAQFNEQRVNRVQGDRDSVLNAVRARGLPIIDFEARLRATDDPLQYFPFRKKGHFTEDGYALLTEQILENMH